jgi:RNA polymerase sigma-70 factor (ECF subfamily)
VGDRRPLRDLSDDQLVDLCKAGNHGAFTEIVDRYKDRVHWLVRRMVGGPDDEDLTQEVFLRVYQAIPNFRGESTFRTWLYRIAHNLCVTDLQRRGRRGEHLSLEEEGEEKVHWLLPEPREGLEERIERQDFSDKVRALIQKLPGPYRTVLTLFYIQQVRYEEIAEIMDVPVGTVKTHIHRARLRLRDLVLADTEIAGLIEMTGRKPPRDGGDQ